MNNSILDDFKNAWNKPNNSPAQLIIINVIIYLILIIAFLITRFTGFGVYEFVNNQFLIPPTFGEFLTRPWTIITYAFAHSLTDILHILVNMLVFYWFSRIILEFLGNKRVISLYILGALAGSIAYLIAFNLIPPFIEISNFSGMVGASGAVMAIVVGAAVFMPNYTFFLMFIGPVQIKYIAAFYVVISLLGTGGWNAGGNLAHLGGALMGWLYIAQLKNGVDIGAWIIVFIDWVKSFFVPQPKIKVTHKAERPNARNASSGKSSGPSKPDQEEIDAILDKISQSGYDSLTKDEKQKLFNASK